jgi:GNAT superfamily N-acetyltransferase
MGGVRIRAGTEADVPAVLDLLERAAAWLVARGRTGQWGSAPQSTDPRRIEAVTRWARSGQLHVAVDDRTGATIGALAVGSAPAYAPPATVPEVYVTFLVTDRDRAGEGIGGRLLAYAEELARRAGVAVVRVDCYAGDDRALVRWYEAQGFTATAPFTVELARGPWPGQVLERRLR